MTYSGLMINECKRHVIIVLQNTVNNYRDSDITKRGEVAKQNKGTKDS